MNHKVKTKNHNEHETHPPAKVGLLDEVKAVCTASAKLKAARQQAGTLISQREAELAQSRRGLARRQSRTLIDGGDLDGDSSESQAFVNATLNLEKARATLGGIEKRIQDQDPQIEKLAALLQSDREKYNATVTGGFLKTVWPQLRSIYLQREALEQALGTTIPELSGLPQPDNAIWDGGSWQQEPEAVALHTTHSAHRLATEMLEEHLRDADSRRVTRQRNMSRPFRPPFNPAGKYRVSTPMTIDGHLYNDGDELPVDSIDLRTLGILYNHNKVQLIPEKEEWAS